MSKFYGDQCMVTGCKIVDILEAAHISPYRGECDNDVENGLLLRADIHTLFDLNLLGIEPKSLIVHIHSDLQKTEYKIYEDKKLICATHNISRQALETRWKKFQRDFNR